DTRLILAVSGNSPVEFNPWNLIPDSLASQVEIQRILEGEMHSVVSPDEAERLYPGRKTIESNPIGREDAWSIMTFGKNYSAPAVLVYEFKLKNIKPSLISDNTFLHARNGVTGKQIELSKVPTLAQDELNTSPHPWRLQKENTKMIKQVLLSGDIDVSEDMTFESNQHVEIAPGTVFRMGKNRSVIFHGKVSAIGNADNPIIFKQKIDGESWGAIIVKGQRASESHFSHIKVTGGSLVSHELIDYPGQFNIHDVESFTLSHCLIENNTIGDDALHVAYSQGAIDHCHFENTAFDALDMDIVNVNLSYASFRNIGNDAVDLMTSIASAENIDIENTGDKCFSIGEASQVQIKQANMKGCEIGVAVKDDSVAQIDDISFGTNISSPIALYRKNPRYSKGGTISGGNLKGITLDAIQISETSMSHIIQESLVENHAKP
ncbi:MAG: hypothetical protein QNJ56_12365, partial [Gammaproteobacteria bacterium]|nr:hypothetical protein [Gammaproteobacteria bacterium]